MKKILFCILTSIIIMSSCSEDCGERANVTWTISCSNCTEFENVNLSVGNSTVTSFLLNGPLERTEKFLLSSIGTLTYEIERDGVILKEGMVNIDPCFLNSFSTTITI